MAGVPGGASEGLQAPPAVRWICRTLEEAGFETWAVGGAVRDALAGRPSADWDLTTRATPRQMRRLFRRTVPLGIEHGTVGILARDGTLYEVTTFRRDVETSGRHAVVAFAQHLDEDLARRDFTINAVAWHPLREVFHDPFGGREDLSRKVLQTVGDPRDRFAEDYLRVLRALRFAGRFRLRVAPATWVALCEAVPRMGLLSAERVRGELEKVLADPRPSGALSLQAASGVMAFFHPELDTPEAHSRWTWTLAAVDRLPPDRELRLAALLAATGSTEAAMAVLFRLRSSNRCISEVGALAGAAAAFPPDATFLERPRERRRWLVRLGRSLAPRGIRLAAATTAARLAVEKGRVAGVPSPEARQWPARVLRALRQDLRSGIPLSTGELALDGRDLIRAGFRPGPAFGQVLEALLEGCLEDPSRNRHDHLLARATALLGEETDGADRARGGGRVR